MSIPERKEITDDWVKKTDPFSDVSVPITWNFDYDRFPIGKAVITENNLDIYITDKSVISFLKEAPVILGASVIKVEGLPDKIMSFSLSPVPAIEGN